MSAFGALVRFAFANDPAALPRLEALCKAKAGTTRDAEDDAQDALFKLLRSRDRAKLIVFRLGERNEDLRNPLAAAAEGSIPDLSDAVQAAGDRQLASYVARMIKNARTDRWRKLKDRQVTPHDDEIGAAGAWHDNDEGLLRVREIVVAAVELDSKRPDWLDDAIGQVEELAVGRVEMEELTRTCIDADLELRALAPEAARVRARNRLQKNHERARLRLLEESERLVDMGRLTPDEGTMAKEWVAFLKRRRQKAGANASGRSV